MTMGLSGYYAQAQHTLFQKYAGNPVFDIGANVPTWRGIHAANVSILGPSDTPDGKWRLYLRGSGDNIDGYHDNIGMFDQDAADFSPYGPWKEYHNNPNLPHGPSGSYDEMHVLDAVARKGANDAIYLYYMSRNNANTAGLSGAISTDGGLSFTKFATNPLKWDVGPNDMIYHNDQYYMFYGDAKWNGSGFDEKLQIWVSVSDRPDQLSFSPTYAIQVGDDGAFDSESVNGAKIFKVPGDSRWFMIYQTSSEHFDYPDRFHAAYSTDLINWTKVINSTPLFTRGSLGEWDQGGIWTGSVIEHNNSLYIYYEGWGSLNQDHHRDQAYYAGGNSRVGVASASVPDFLNWVSGSSLVTGVNDTTTASTHTDNKLNAYPNPTTEKLHLEFDGLVRTGSIEILNEQGAILKHFKINNTTAMNISIQEFSTHVIFLRIVMDDKVVIKRILVK